MHVPKYRKQSGRDFAFVEHKRERHRLPGRFNSPESRNAYKQFVGRILGESELPELIQAADAFTVELLIAGFLKHAETRYGKNSRGEWANCKHALQHLKTMFGPFLAESIGPVLLKELRRSLLKEREPGYVNQVCGKIKRAYKWAVSEELLPVTVYQALMTVPDLPARRCNKKPVARADVDAILSELSATVAAMTEFQWLTGARSQSICHARPEQFDQTTNPWLWRPRHKQESTGQDLVIPIGPKCQAVLRPFLERRKPTQYLFNPREARDNRRYNEHYKSGSFRQHVQRAIDRVNGKRRKEALEAGTKAVEIVRWSPHGLRHSKGHAVRGQYGAEAAQAVLGHESLEATQLYSERRLELAIEVAKEMG